MMIIIIITVVIIIISITVDVTFRNGVTHGALKQQSRMRQQVKTKVNIRLQVSAVDAENAMKHIPWRHIDPSMPAYHNMRVPGTPEAFQDWYGENHPMSRPDDGGTEGPERGAGGAKRRSAEGVG